ncbi:hypothetical protein ACFYTQ_02115 [Nocardia sp. NPDC004068]|uniref:hypothetical protein n=1 Tax=Nocardia sp. NPDC004068 TaxID=3364303 RepID=UPI0036AFC09C
MAVTTTSPITALTAAPALVARRAATRPTTPAALAARLISGCNVTPTIALLSAALRRAITSSGQQIIISTPPRTR